MSVDKIKRMKELIPILDRAAKAYYQEGTELMSNLEYDALYDELVMLEDETGTVLSQSPTQKVGYEVLSALPKENHESPMLSLAKTKERAELSSFLADKKGVLSWKLDGLTVVLTYEEGKLVKAVTRGNGEVGEIVTSNAKVFENIPLKIPFKGRLTLRGEAVISYAAFEEINAALPEGEVIYKNPRNLCSGSVRQLDSGITAQRHVNFIAFSLVNAEGEDFENSRLRQFDFLKRQGFTVVEHRMVSSDDVQDAVGIFEKNITANEYPSDGLVLLLEDIAYGESLGRTAKFPRNAIAFKWKDEECETVLREIEWSPSRTGLLNPVAVFDPVELEGTTVSRASVHNVSVLKELGLGIGDRILVYKANMIIPQISANLTKSGNIVLPAVCPVCGGNTEAVTENESEVLTCANPSCPAKRIKAFCLYVSRDAMNIEGLSEQTLEKFIEKGFLTEYSDLYDLKKHASEIMSMESFGEKSCDKLLAAIEKSKTATAAKFIYAIGIPGIGVANARILALHFDEDINAFMAADEDELSSIDNIGPVMAADIVRYFADDSKRETVLRAYSYLKIEKSKNADMSSPIAGKVFVITGTVEKFRNRNELKAFIQERGGKVTGSVTKNTDYLINNDTMSKSSKNRQAAELSIPVISEDEFLALIQKTV